MGRQKRSIARLVRTGKIQRLIDRILFAHPGYALCPENKVDGRLKLTPTAVPVMPKRFRYLFETSEVTLLEFYSRTAAAGNRSSYITASCEHTCLLFGNNPTLGHDIHILLVLSR